MALEWLGYFETIETFTFREKTSISIPKRVRERAFSLQVDCEIVSTDGNDYVNNKSIPAYGFYGYAVLVFRNFAEIQIPLNQPRQRLYYGRVPEAYTNWYQLYLWRAFREYTKGLADVLGQIGTAVGLGEAIVPPVPCLGWSGFEELPLREVYVKTRFGTQFKLEVSRWEAVERNGDTDCDYSPVSGQADNHNEDGTGKDDGLPPLGSQPQHADSPLFPYAGLPNPSTNAELGEYGLNKFNNVDSPNPDNAADTSSTIYWLKIEATASGSSLPYGCAKYRVATYYYQLLDNTITWTTSSRDVEPDGCGGRRVAVSVTLSGGDGTPLAEYNTTDGQLTVTRQSGTSLPANTLEYFDN